MQGTAPEPRYGQSTTLISGGMLLVHGGMGAKENSLDDVHILKIGA